VADRQVEEAVAEAVVVGKPDDLKSDIERAWNRSLSSGQTLMLVAVSPSMSAKAGKKKISNKQEQEQDQADGLWIDATLMAKLHGRRSALALSQTFDTESQRLLHYADVLLGTDKKEKFVSSKPIKNREKE
jgi:hypothetical protein